MFELIGKGYVPVLAHPERYRMFLEHPYMIEKYIMDDDEVTSFYMSIYDEELNEKIFSASQVFSEIEDEIGPLDVSFPLQMAFSEKISEVQDRYKEDYNIRSESNKIVLRQRIVSQYEKRIQNNFIDENDSLTILANKRTDYHFHIHYIHFYNETLTILSWYAILLQ